ncbi:GGDEF domain-containing protein [Oceanospirillum sp. D5]|uniref:diguanylate cyclase n=2 Tax=Oceanospirillum sediminis TaxID=2760088 RepID=A0A839IQN9_9GAMM|nr:GGDEF domain-containing protein [Oceanospirillum sediminis]
MNNMNNHHNTQMQEKALFIARKGLWRFILLSTLQTLLGTLAICYLAYWLINPALFNNTLALMLPALVPPLVSPVVSYFSYRVFSSLADDHLQLHQEVLRRQLLERELRMQANTDMLTGLSNRRAFFEEAERRLARGHQTLVLIDLDFFKAINDQHGHDIGDHVLVRMAQLLSDNFEPEALLARLGGEEFAFLSSLESELLIDQLQQINRTLQKNPMKIKKLRVDLSLSAGVVIVEQNGDLQEGLIQADTCLYHAKRNGRCQIQTAGTSS